MYQKVRHNIWASQSAIYIVPGCLELTQSQFLAQNRPILAHMSEITPNVTVMYGVYDTVASGPSVHTPNTPQKQKPPIWGA